MVRSGEGSGRLEDVLERVAFHLEKLDALSAMIRAAMLYPSFVFALALVVMLAVVAFIVPVFAGSSRRSPPIHRARTPACRC